MKGGQPGPSEVEGERGTTLVNRGVSLQSRLSRVLALSLMSALGLGSLAWYYAHSMTRQSRARQSAQSASASRAQGDTALPSIGRIDPPPPPPVPAMDVIVPADVSEDRPASALSNHAHGDSPGPGARQRRVRAASAADPGAAHAGSGTVGRGVLERIAHIRRHGARDGRDAGRPDDREWAAVHRAVRRFLRTGRARAAPEGPRRARRSARNSSRRSGCCSRKGHSSTARSRPPSTPRFRA